MKTSFLGRSLKVWNPGLMLSFFSFLPREKLLVGLFFLGLLRFAGLELLWLVWNGFPHLFQCDCSWVWTCPGYCDFLVGSWSSHKDFWGYILLTWHLCGEVKSRASYFAIWLMSFLKPFLVVPRPGNLPHCPSAEAMTIKHLATPLSLQGEKSLLSRSKHSPIQPLTTGVLDMSVFLLCLIMCTLLSLHAAGERVLLAISGTDVFWEDAVFVGSVWSQRSWASALPPLGTCDTSGFSLVTHDQTHTSLLGGTRRCIPLDPKNPHGKWHQGGHNKQGQSRFKPMRRDWSKGLALPEQSLAHSSEDEADSYPALHIPLFLLSVNSLSFLLSVCLSAAARPESVVKEGSDCLVEGPSKYPLNWAWIPFFP